MAILNSLLPPKNVAGAAALLLCWAALPCCTPTGVIDVKKPILVQIADSFSQANQQGIRNAAECWNIQFGTRFTFDRDSIADQHLIIEPSEFLCVYAGGRTEYTKPMRISVCSRLLRSSLFFVIVAHEMGHVLNIVFHAEDKRSLMQAGIADLRYGNTFFSDEDRQLFREANDDFITSCDPIFFRGHYCVCAN